MEQIIEPRILKGFRDFLPQSEMTRITIQKTLVQVFSQLGFVPIDTPILEYTDVLLGKGGGETDKQVYRFIDAGGRDVAMRFDLTVPFARYMAAHINELYLPFKRYHIAKVWRGENTQRGRFREFVQCDFDIVGVDSPSADFEILLCIHKSFEALGVKKRIIHYNHRGVFNKFLEKIECREHSVEILRNVDKLSKLGRNKVASSLSELVNPIAAEKILDFVTPESSFDETIDKMITFSGGRNEAVERLLELNSYMNSCNIAGNFLLDPAITRGLDYYTGVVYETFLQDLPEIGSVCSGGRYNNLASLYTKEQLPGVGSSIGLDRLVSALDQLNVLSHTRESVDCIIFCMNESFFGWYHSLSEKLRNAGISCEVYPENKKLSHQFNYAEKKSIPFALLCGENEKKADALTVKNLLQRKNFEMISFEDAVAVIREKQTGPRETTS